MGFKSTIGYYRNLGFVKNMGGIGAHCFEDYQALQMFVEPWLTPWDFASEVMLRSLSSLETA